jgi:transposase
MAALRERGSHASLPMGGDTRSQRVEALVDFLLGLHRREHDLTLNEIRDRLHRARGEKVWPSMIWRLFDRHDITLKKIAHASEQDRPDVLSGDGDVGRSTRLRSTETGVRRWDGGDDQHGAPLAKASIGVEK